MTCGHCGPPMTRAEKLALALESPPWMYAFDLGDGVTTPLLADELDSIHRTRAELLDEALDAAFPAGLQGRRCLDVGCNEGFFSHRLYRRGARVDGIDIRAQNIRRARAVQRALGLDPARLAFAEADLFRFDPGDEPYDVVLFFGVLYHLENPMGALRRIRAMTRSLCVVESQVTRQHAPVVSGWGRAGATMSLPASLAVFHEEQQEADRLAAHGGVLSFIPNLAALQLMLRAAGFARAVRLAPRPGMNAQYVAQDRVVLAAFVEG